MTSPSRAAEPLNDAEIGELDDLLAAIPAPLEPLDVVMLDGYLCGVIAQPQALAPDQWLPPAFDWRLGENAEAGSVLAADTPGWHGAKHERLLTLVQRHHAVLERQLREDAWFDPLVMEPQDDDGKALAGAAAIGPAIAPWVAGFEQALACFPALETLTHEDLPDLLDCLRRHLPAQDEDEAAVVKALDQEHPLKNLDEAIADLVDNVVAIADLGRGERLKVETVRRAGPKVGRNDPCPCGSGRKFKQCHGAATA
ncbi:MAG TPA: UPF0149 family protein [Methylibium sp.]|uniref:UPF0149 family protein n=1 Tax=Methylibium sp. TaxID=2067992 RepID=UPI002DB7FED7|nr:UPF0149 family protein [Methylibium sp.]HEU4458622.1 UPF0149 family protein [Methylibium sp.]